LFRQIDQKNIDSKSHRIILETILQNPEGRGTIHFVISVTSNFTILDFTFQNITSRHLTSLKTNCHAY